MILLTLDLATNVGFTFGGADVAAFEHGSHRLPSGEVGRLIHEFSIWLKPKLDAMQGEDDLVVFESPILPKHAQLATLRKLYGLSAVTECMCYRMGIRCNEGNNRRVKAFMGNGRMKKHEMVLAVRRYGFEVQDHDEADAIALRLYALHQRFPDAARKLNLGMGPLGAETSVS